MSRLYTRNRENRNIVKSQLVLLALIHIRAEQDLLGNIRYSVTILSMNIEIEKYNNSQTEVEKNICNLLANTIDSTLTEAESKIWHAHPVWFLDGNPVVGYSKLKDGVRLLFWSGQTFNEPTLQNEGSFKAAEARYTSVEEVNLDDLKRWLDKARDIQWDYKNIVKRKGELVRLK